MRTKRGGGGGGGEYSPIAAVLRHVSVLEKYGDIRFADSLFAYCNCYWYYGLEGLALWYTGKYPCMHTVGQSKLVCMTLMVVYVILRVIPPKSGPPGPSVAE